MLTNVAVCLSEADELNKFVPPDLRNQELQLNIESTFIKTGFHLPLSFICLAQISFHPVLQTDFLTWVQLKL